MYYQICTCRRKGKNATVHFISHTNFCFHFIAIFLYSKSNVMMRLQNVKTL